MPDHTKDPAVAEEKELAIESIGWLFIQKYYTTYTARKPKLFGFYDVHASVLHDAFPDSAKKVHSAVGVDAIKAYFAEVDSAGAKIVVDRADFQWAGGNILIVVSGSWKRGLSPLWPFVQTFVLAAKEKTVFDVSNDVLRFVDLAEAYEPQTPEHKADELNHEEQKQESPEKQEKAAEAPQTEPETDTAPQVADAGSTGDENDGGDESVSPEAEVAEPAVSGSEEDKKPGAKPTWATLAAIEPKPSLKSAAVAPPGGIKAAVAPPAAVKKPTPPTVGAPAGVKFKREEWHPIYIRNIEVEEDELKSALMRVFGDIKYFRKSNRTALCDFCNKADQLKALEAKEIVIGGNTISLEPRLLKAFKPEVKKDKKQVKKNGVKPKN